MFLFIFWLWSRLHIFLQSQRYVISSRNQNKFLKFKSLFLPEPLVSAKLEFSQDKNVIYRSLIMYLMQNDHGT